MQVVSSYEDEKEELHKRCKSGAVCTDFAAIGKCQKEDKATASRFIRSILCDFVFAEKWLSMGHVA